MQFLKLLSETPGVPGREERIRAVIEQEISPRGRPALFDQQRIDALGSLICLKKPFGRAAKRSGGARAGRVMIAAHMDQIGFYVKHIDDKGFVRIHNVGGFDPRNLLARRVLIQGKKDLPGILNPATKPIHIATEEDKKKQFTIPDFAIDTGLPVEKVKELIKIGDPVTLVAEFSDIGDLLTGQAMDNRAACWTAVRALQKITRSPYETAVVFTVQEEVGLRGAGPATFGLEPDIAICLDTTLACDTPGTPDDQAITRAGKGVGIKIMDSASISNRELVDEFVAVAEKHKIPYQLELLPMGGTDAGAMQRTRVGYKTVTLSIPTRYIHTVTESVHRNDLNAARDLLAAWLEGG